MTIIRHPSGTIRDSLAQDFEMPEVVDGCQQPWNIRWSEVRPMGPQEVDELLPALREEEVRVSHPLAPGKDPLHLLA